MFEILFSKNYYRWTRSCEALENKIPEFADSSLVNGWLQIMGAGAETDASLNYRIPGTEFKYRCSDGFYLPNKTNPDQMLQCQGSRLVDTSAVTSCIRKSGLSI